MGKVSCIIVNYNDWVRTVKLVNSIIDYEIISHVIVVDNCSSDQSRDELTKLKHKKYVFVPSPRNGGYGYGNNIGIKKAKELADGFVLISNPDVIFDENCVRHMVSILQKYENCAIVGAKEVYRHLNGWKYTSGLHDVLSTSLFFNKLLKARYYPDDYFLDKNIAEVDIIPGCFLMSRVSTMFEVGMYDEDFFLYEEEKVIYRRTIEKGYNSLVDLTCEYEHRHINIKDGDKVSPIAMARGKERLLESKRLFLKKYRKFNDVQLFLSNCFFALTKVEMFLYGLILKTRVFLKK